MKKCKGCGIKMDAKQEEMKMPGQWTEVCYRCWITGNIDGAPEVVISQWKSMKKQAKGELN